METMGSALKAKGLAAGLIAFMLCVVALLVGTGARSAYAADATLYDPTKVTLTKVLEADPSIDTNGLAFTFSFDATGDPDGGTTTASETPAIASLSLVAQAMTSDVQLLQRTNFIPVASAFPHAGVYAYDVYESAVPIAHPSGSTPATSDAHYLMRVYVENAMENGAYTGALTIRGVTVERTASDIPPVRQPLEKVNPVPDPNDDNDPGGFAFTNIYSKTADLTVSKAVEGAAADRTKHFSYSMSFVIPETQQRSVAQTYVGTITSTSGSSIPASDTGHASTTTITFTVAADQRLSDTQTFELSDGEQLVLPLPTGTTYEITETGASGYTPTATITNTINIAGTETVTGSAVGTSGSNLLVGPSITAVVSGELHPINVVPAEGSDVAFVNSYTAPTPTGIIVANLPYILMIGIPVAALAAWLAVHRRRARKA